MLSHTPKQVQVNLETALPAIVSHIKGGWDNIQSLHIKTSTSISLPIWTCDLGSEEGGRWNGLVAGDTEEAEEKVASENSEDEDEGEGDEEEDEEPVKPKTVGVGKGMKRQLEDKTEQPKKRPKASLAARTK